MTTYNASLDYLVDTTTPPEKTATRKSQKELKERSQSRNHFLRFVVINMVVWPLVAFIGLQVAQSHTPAVSKSLLKTSGAQSMSADELTAVVRAQSRPIFWLGRLSGDTYAENSTVAGVDVITYLPENATPQTHGQLDLVVKTYRDSAIFNVQLHPLSGTADTTVEQVGGMSVTYNPASPDHSIVSFKDKAQVITLTYPSFQSTSTLIMDAQNLAPIK